MNIQNSFNLKNKKKDYGRIVSFIYKPKINKITNEKNHNISGLLIKTNNNYFWIERIIDGVKFKQRLPIISDCINFPHKHTQLFKENIKLTTSH